MKRRDSQEAKWAPASMKKEELHWSPSATTTIGHISAEDMIGFGIESRPTLLAQEPQDHLGKQRITQVFPEGIGAHEVIMIP